MKKHNWSKWYRLDLPVLTDNGEKMALVRRCLGCKEMDFKEVDLNEGNNYESCFYEVRKSRLDEEVC